jgi:type I restriction enzyme, S subunit
MWETKEIADVCEIIGGGTPPTKEEDNFGGEIAWLTPADLTDYKRKYISKGRRNLTKAGLDNSSAKLLPRGSVLFSSRAPIGYVAISENPMATNQGFRSLVPNDKLNNEYLYYFLKSAKHEAEKLASGTTFKEISGKNLGRLKIPIPPLPTQNRIVEKIEELFSELDNGVENLKKARKQLKTCRQAVLKDAFEGKLTKEWREQQDDLSTPEELLRQIKAERKAHRQRELAEWEKEVEQWEKDGGKGKKPPKPRKSRCVEDLKEDELTGLHDLPENWVWGKINDITLRVEYGTSNKSLDEGEIPVLRMGNMQIGKLINVNSTLESLLNFNSVPKYLARIIRKNLYRKVI